MYLTAILRDYLRAFAKNTYAIGNALFEKDGEENNCFFIRAVSSAEEGQADGALEDWRKMVNDVADLFDNAADLCVRFIFIVIFKQGIAKRIILVISMEGIKLHVCKLSHVVNLIRRV